MPAHDPSDAITLSAAAEANIVTHARAEAPRECCGLLIGSGTAVSESVAASNVAETPITRYLIDPHDHLRAIRRARGLGLEVVGAYHSHPRSPAAPSATDRAAGFGGFVFLIVSLASDVPDLTAWTWTDGNFTRVPLVRVPEGKG